MALMIDEYCMTKGFVFQPSFFRQINRKAKASDRERAYRYICEYMFLGKLPDISDSDVLADFWDGVYPTLHKVKALVYSKSQGSTSESTSESTSGSTSESTSGSTSFKGNKENKEDKEIKEKESKEKEKSPAGDRSGKPQASPSPVVRFIPPTLDEVKAYVQEKGFHFDPEAFHAFYESKGWKVGNTPMKSWRMACVTWEKREPEPEQEQPKPKPIPKVSQCPQCGGYDLKTSYNRLMCRGCGAIYDYSHAKGKWERV